MNILQKGIITILKSSITGEAYKLPEEFVLEEAAIYIRRHGIAPLIYVGAVNCGISKAEPFMQKLFQAYCKMLLHSEKQMKDVNKIYEAFEENGIDYMPVKGCNMKGLYPAPEMRVMGDADILIKLNQYDKVEKVMNELGFNFLAKGDHDFAWNSENLHVELHYLLMYAYNETYGKYFGNGWNRVAGNTGHKYHMLAEDDFIFQFIHFTKHYRIGGIGLRHVVDLWVYLRSHPDLDFKYIEDIIGTLSVSEFYRNTMKLIDMWFNDGEGDAKADLMTEFIFVSGSWGTAESAALSKGVKALQETGDITKGKVKLYRDMFFPPINELSNRYTILDKAPILLPVIWVWRWIDSALHRRNNVKTYCKQVKAACGEGVSEYEKSLEFVGLNFTFEEVENDSEI